MMPSSAQSGRVKFEAEGRRRPSFFCITHQECFYNDIERLLHVTGQDYYDFYAGLLL